MFQATNYAETLSLKLSEVLADIGVHEGNVIKTRRLLLLNESLHNICYETNGTKVSNLLLGSQTEGTTTPGLKSDLDILECYYDILVIQNWSDWTPGFKNYHLMIQNDSVSPGYCFLQHLQCDDPLPCHSESCQSQHTFIDRTGKLLVKNSFPSVIAEEGEIRHGPASSSEGSYGFLDTDRVLAIHCKTWPEQAKQWLDLHDECQWPSGEMKQYCRRTGCFVVGVGSRGSENEQLEWRISTSLAERCLMFSLNITQIRCYILMKMILKTLVNPVLNDVISSYMCKTVLFHCISKTHANIWREDNLFPCLYMCLSLLYRSIVNESCPHFIIPANNLLRGKISPAVKPFILELLSNVINSSGQALLEIPCDNLGLRLQLKFCNFCPFKTSTTSTVLAFLTLQHGFGIVTSTLTLGFRNPRVAVQTLKHNISNICRHQHDGFDKIAYRLLLRWYCVTLGSILASTSINQYNTVPADAFTLLSLGQNTDVASSKLKLASILCCLQEIQRADSVLREIERNFDRNIVEPFCVCYHFPKPSLKVGFVATCDIHNEEALQYATATCVRFLPCEMHCVPKELRYEMFRSTEEDRMLRKKEDCWMDFAVVDSLPFLYFLQYKVYNNLGRIDDKQSALSELLITINEETNLGHRETALNLLGKCFEQEGRHEEALQCYSRSLGIRRRNNAANIHIAALLSRLINARAWKQQ